MKTLTALEGLAEAEAGSYYTIAGVGGPIHEWVTGYTGLLNGIEAGTPQEWFTTTGVDVNQYAAISKHAPIFPRDKFPDDLVFLLFPLDGLNLGVLAPFKLQMQDRWFDDVVQNMRVVRG